MSGEEFLIRLFMKALETLGFGVIAVIVMLLIQLVVYQTTGFSIYNYFVKELSK